MIRQFFLVLYFLMFFNLNAREPLFLADLKLSSDSIVIPDQLRIEATLKYPQGYQLDFDQLRNNLLQTAITSIQPFSLISQTVKPLETDIHGTRTQKILYVLDPKIPGPQTVSLYNVKFIDSSNKEKFVEIFSDFHKIEVELPAFDPQSVAKPLSPLPLTQQFPIQISAQNRRDLQNGPDILALEAKRNVRVINERTFPWKTFWLFLALTTAFLVFRESLLRYLKKLVLKWITKTPEEKAKTALSKLKREELPQKGSYDQYFVELTTLLRSYLDEKYNLNSQEETTEEFLQNENTKAYFTPKQRELLSRLLIKADVVKFAKGEPHIEDCETAEQAVETLILSSEPKK